MDIALLTPENSDEQYCLDQALQIYAAEQSLNGHEIFEVCWSQLSEKIEKTLPSDIHKWIVVGSNIPIPSHLRTNSLPLSKFHSLTLKIQPLSQPNQSWLFCGPPSKDFRSDELWHAAIDWTNAAYEQINAINPTLRLIGEQNELDLGVDAGNNTLFCPQFPYLATQAIASSSFVVSFRLQPVLVALAHGVPALLLTAGRDTAKAARELSIPTLKWNRRLSKGKLVEEIKSLQANYPWDRIQPKIDKQVSDIKNTWADNKLKLAQNKTLQFNTEINKPSGELLEFCCVADKKFIPFWGGLIQNLLLVHGTKLKAHLLAIDTQAADYAKQWFPDLDLTIYSLADIWGDHNERLLRSKPVQYQAMSSKSQLLLHIVEKSKRPLFFFDLDMCFFHSPAHLNDDFGNGSVLLFPQWSDVYAWFRNHGMFNSGIVGVRPGAEAALKWWSDQCLEFLSFDVSQGYYGDQSFWDLAPLYFDNITIYRGLDENVAPWNRKTLGVHDTPNRPWHLHVEDEKPVGSFHVAGPDDSGIFEIKHGWDQLCTFFGPKFKAHHLGPLFSNTLDQQRRHWARLDGLLSAHKLMSERSKLKPPALTPTNVQYFIQGKGRPLVTGFSLSHKLYRGIKSLWRAPQIEDPKRTENHQKWVQFQRQTLFDASKNVDSVEIKKKAS